MDRSVTESDYTRFEGYFGARLRPAKCCVNVEAAPALGNTEHFGAATYPSILY